MNMIAMKCEALYLTLRVMPLGVWCKTYRDGVHVGMLRIQRKGDVLVMHCWNGKARNDGATNTHVRFSRAKLQAWYESGNVGVVVPVQYKSLLTSNYASVLKRLEKTNPVCKVDTCNIPVTSSCISCDRRKNRCKTPLLLKRSTVSQAISGIRTPHRGDARCVASRILGCANAASALAGR
jgi:hypothetical protein